LGQGLIFKLEEEEKSALLLHLPALSAETADLGSATGSGCRLVVATAQPVRSLDNSWEQKSNQKKMILYPL
jgi:hypothetical protein